MNATTAVVIRKADGTYAVDVIGRVFFGNGREGHGYVRSVPCADSTAADRTAACINAEADPDRVSCPADDRRPMPAGSPVRMMRCG
jgi:hypothetical protein